MLFSSIPFLFYFLPCVLFLYFAAPRSWRNAVLLLASLFFYGWGEPRYLLLMLADITLGYMLGLLIEKHRGSRHGRLYLALSVAVSVGLLGYFKYADFFIANFNAVTGLSLPLLRIALPIGISFYTFQILSYTVDIYRGEVAAQRDPVTLGAYIAMFPQLIAGPIVRYRDVEAQLMRRTHTPEKLAQGARRFILGLSKKLLLANILGELCAAYSRSGDPSVLLCWLYAVGFSLQVYFDFSGYSDMAIGLGHILGFEFPENFNYPYIAASITEFWRRWHISLGSWFRDYVYIPLGGNRVSRLRWLRNIFVVWMLTGFWHGAAWNFVIWGLYFAVLLLIEKLWLQRFLQKARVLSHLYVLLSVVISFVIFDAGSMGDALACIKNMLGLGGIPLVSAEGIYYLHSYAVVLAVAAVGATPLARWAAEGLRRREQGALLVDITEPVALSVLLLVGTAYLVDGSFNPFLYFRF